MRQTPVTTKTNVNGTLSTEFTTKEKYQQLLTGSTSVRITALTASAEL
jgi:hypothetical protein